MLAVFERYDLAESPDERPTYAAIARDLAITPITVTNHLAAMRRQFRRVVLDRALEQRAHPLLIEELIDVGRHRWFVATDVPLGDREVE